MPEHDDRCERRLTTGRTKGSTLYTGCGCATRRELRGGQTISLGGAVATLAMACDRCVGRIAPGSRFVVYENGAVTHDGDECAR